VKIGISRDKKHLEDDFGHNFFQCQEAFERLEHVVPLAYQHHQLRECRKLKIECLAAL
jgi:hypothetical protein